VGTAHEVNSSKNQVTIFLDDDGEAETSFQINPKHFQKLLQNYYKTKFSTDQLIALLMSSD